MNLKKLEERLARVADLKSRSSRYRIEEGPEIVAEAWEAAFKWLVALTEGTSLSPVVHDEYTEGMKKIQSVLGSVR